MRHDKKTMNFQRKYLALLGFLLPVLAPGLGFIAGDKNAPDFWHSISATYYSTSGWIMAGILFTFACFLFSYKGYDIGDRSICVFSGMMALSILIFPCKTTAAGETVGILNLPVMVSHGVHCISAALLFGSFAYMIGLRFTKTDKILALTSKKYIRNRLYKTCSLLIVTMMLVQLLTSLLDIGWMTIVNEAVMLWAFSLAWAVKAGCFKILNDDFTKY